MVLHDGALTLVAVVGFFIPASTILVALRLLVRWRNRGFGVDDGLVLVGWVSVTVTLLHSLADITGRCCLFHPSPF